MTARLKLRVIPNAAKNQIVGRYGDALKVKVRSPALEGKANAALLEFLAEVLGLPRAHVVLESGETARIKLVRIEGLTEAEIHAKLGL
ncbi:MAG: YggU family protein [Bdellovibrionales bacterium]|nr:YggU family protein [Bdellovibrionales bacterium]